MKSFLMNAKWIYLILITTILFGCNAGTSSPVSPSSGTAEDVSYIEQVNSINVSGKRLSGIKQEIVDYYSKANILKTYNEPQYTIVCVPFDQQPSLINKSPSEKAAAYNPLKYIKTSTYMQKMMSNSAPFQVKADLCDVGDVAINRPLLKTLKRGNVNAFAKSSVNHSSIAANTDGYNWAQPILAGLYSNDTSILIPGDAKSVMARFSEVNRTRAIVREEDQSHIINQIWWTNHAGSGDLDFASIEAGIITSNYFTDSVQTTLFIYSTNNDYNGGGYNLIPGMFVQYPNTPALGTPIDTSNHYAIKFRIIPEGYELDLYISPDTSDDYIAMGYYPYSYYSDRPATETNYMRFFSVGAEIYHDSSSSNVLHAGGTIHGVAIDSTILEMTGIWASDSDILAGAIARHQGNSYATFYYK